MCCFMTHFSVFKWKTIGIKVLMMYLEIATLSLNKKKKKKKTSTWKKRLFVTDYFSKLS